MLSSVSRTARPLLSKNAIRFMSVNILETEEAVTDFVATNKKTVLYYTATWVSHLERDTSGVW